jgi:transmembrane sensor
MEEQDLIKALLEKHKAGTITDAEKAVLDKWYLHVAADSSEELSDADRLQTFDTVLANLEEIITEKRQVKRLWPRIAAAASILLALSVGGYFVLHRGAPAVQVAQTHDVAPGANSATLTLSNGKQIVLNSKPQGQLALQGNVAVNKTASGQIQYAVTGSNTEVMMNTVATKRKEQYHVVLADGTGVWLNAESSLKYPVAFNGSERKVELTGEAYFEVAHNKAKPFRVTSKGQTVEVLGTHFNINSYANESGTKTTLLEGSVKVLAGNSEQKIKPGQQSIFSNNGLQVKDADTELATAWHNGDFLFKGEKIETIMRQLARWYDIDVVYNGKPTTEGFYAGISRFKNISQVLNLLEQSKGVHFKVEGRSVTVMQ